MSERDISFWRNLLRENEQEQLLAFWEELNPKEKENLLADLEKLDFNEIRRAMTASRMVESGAQITPIETMERAEIKKRQAGFKRKGLEALADGKLACVLLAGGQGTRLGFDGPKGCYNIGTKAPLSIFECLMRNLEDVVWECGRLIPLCIMTSELNDAATRAFFEENDYFGYPKTQIHFFVQDMAPALSFDGKVLLKTKSSIAFAPNGNGGWFSSLQKCGLLSKLREAGAEWLNVFSVDNVLQSIADPIFLGAVLAQKAGAGAKVVRKATPEERVGAICLKNGRTSVVEYSELSEEMRYQKNPDGGYAYNFGVTLNYLFNIEETLRGLDRAGGGVLPLHLAKKKIVSVNERGESIEPAEPNAYKPETFIFDILELYNKVLSFEHIREEEFAPIKNKEGVDSPDSARALLKAQKPSWREI